MCECNTVTVTVTVTVNSTFTSLDLVNALPHIFHLQLQMILNSQTTKKYLKFLSWLKLH